MEKLRVGLAGVMQMNFCGDKIGQLERSTRELEALAGRLGFDFVAFPRPVLSEADAAEVVAYVRQQRIDFLLVQNSSFAGGRLMLTLSSACGRCRNRQQTVRSRSTRSAA